MTQHDALFIDGPRAGELWAYPETQGNIEVLELNNLIGWTVLEDPTPVAISTQKITYRPFMRSITGNVTLYSVYRTDPARIVVDVLAPVLKFAREQQEREQRAKGLIP
jgi:hypothetical protein